MPAPRLLAENETAAQPPHPSRILPYLNPRRLNLRSHTALVVDQVNGTILFSKNVSKLRSIASITKLITAMVVIDSKLNLETPIKILKGDRDYIRYSRSRLRVGSVVTRGDALKMALVASENRAANSLARTFPGGKHIFVQKMNLKARELGLGSTRLFDPAGLDGRNVSTAYDLVKLINAAFSYDLIRQLSTLPRIHVQLLNSKRSIKLVNTNRLVRSTRWHIGVSKTGFISEAGHCLVMQAEIGNRPVVIVLLKSWGKLSKFGDANRIRSWLINAERQLRYEKFFSQGDNTLSGSMGRPFFLTSK